ncbi:PqqD family protein [Leptolyngbya sp. NK1-12]|uniref:PqqD family protein n=1 Tax=Leptolyngbya sp. NK1-12 TaxID=2547451 RepID=A0AA97AJJ0_9CYAN|nr:PqqD family protein [Leptolyngbya sp. NK1-12]
MSQVSAPLNNLAGLISATKDQVSSDLVGETVILNLKSGVYFGLNEVGTTIWNLIQQPRTLQSIHTSLLAEYDVDSEQCMQDLIAILHDLQAAELIEITHADVE